MASLSFWGGAETVTGSKYLIETQRAKVLVDCGMFQGLKELRERNWQSPPFDPEQLDAVLITHAHIDHTGYLPRLVAQGFRGPVFTSRGSGDLIRILLPDAGRLQEEEADYRNRHNLTKHNPALPLYTEDDAQEAIKLLQLLPNDGSTHDVAPGIRASFRIAGHILGSSLVLVSVEKEGGGENNLLFSGDLGHYDQPIIRDPEPPPACDYLMVESTYGDRLHDPEPPKNAIAKLINEAASRNAVLLIPSFAVGRTQELIYIIRELEDEKRIPVLPVRVDSPMAAAATRAYANRTEEQDADYASLLAKHEKPLQTHSMLLTASREDSKKINSEKGSRIIISSSGMMTGGRVLHHARRILPDSNAIILFVGYQAAGTLGRRILNGENEVRVLGEWTKVRCQIEQIGGFSAHADWGEVIKWLKGMPAPPKRTFVVHGETGSANAMRQHIVDTFGWEVEVPTYGEKFEFE
jgi:metallo-beta-lactamase family protein